MTCPSPTARSATNTRTGAVTPIAGPAPGPHSGA